MTKNLKSDLLLLLAAAIWGFAFVAQKIGMENVGPFTYNGVRFALGALALFPFLLRESRPSRRTKDLEVKSKARFFAPLRMTKELRMTGEENKVLLTGGLIAGFLLFAGVSSQQIGLQWTTAGNAGFVTGLYVVFVPIVGIFVGHKTTKLLWLGVIFAAVGLYFLSVTSDFKINTGDAIVFICAVMWTFHVLVIAKYSPKVNVIKLALIQYVICSVLCMICAFGFENVSLIGIYKAGLPIAYGGLLSVGIAYTLQVYVQKYAHPVAAVVILSLESVFAVIGGWIILSEPMTERSLLGCGLMFSGMVLAQVRK